MKKNSEFATVCNNIYCEYADAMFDYYNSGKREDFLNACYVREVYAMQAAIHYDCMVTDILAIGRSIARNTCKHFSGNKSAGRL